MGYIFFWANIVPGKCAISIHEYGAAKIFQPFFIRPEWSSGFRDEAIPEIYEPIDYPDRVDNVLNSIDKTRCELHTGIMETKGDIKEYQGQVKIIKQRLEKFAKWFAQMERESHK